MVILKEHLNTHEAILVSSAIVTHCSFVLHAFIINTARQQENSISYIQDLQKFVSNHQSTLKHVNGLTNEMEQLYHYSEQLQEMSQSVKQQASNSMNL